MSRIPDGMHENIEGNFWLIGYTDDFRRIVIGNNTGPYSEIKELGPLGGLYTIFVDGKHFCDCEPFSNDGLDSMNRRCPDPDKSFRSTNEITLYFSGLKVH